jgi:IS5 family transposase
MKHGSRKRVAYHFGLKKHHVTANEGLVIGVLSPKASTNEIATLKDVLNTVDLPEGIAFKAGVIKPRKMRRLKKRAWAH